MKVLSLFDGIACGKLSLDKAGINISKYYASEIDTAAINVSTRHHPEIIQLGDVKGWRDWDIDFGDLDLILAGSPCQGFSSAGHRKGLRDERSALFYYFVDILNYALSKNPQVVFLLENVSMKEEYRDIISEALGVEPVTINSEIVCPLSRKRLYWFPWEEREIKEVASSFYEVTDGFPASITGRRIDPITGKRKDNDKEVAIVQCLEVKKNKNKGPCLTTVSKDVVVSKLPHGRYLGAYDAEERQWRNLTNREICIMQTLPHDYLGKEAVNTAYKLAGNCWTVDVIANILGWMQK